MFTAHRFVSSRSFRGSSSRVAARVARAFTSIVLLLRFSARVFPRTKDACQRDAKIPRSARQAEVNRYASKANPATITRKDAALSSRHAPARLAPLPPRSPSFHLARVADGGSRHAAIRFPRPGRGRSENQPELPRRNSSVATERKRPRVSIDATPPRLRNSGREIENIADNGARNVRFVFPRAIRRR